MSEPANRVLIIDDERHIRRFVSTGLEFYGFLVSEAGNGVDGLSAVTRLRPDLVILDLALPDLSGLDVLNAIRSWSGIPVIMLSVEAGEEHKIRLLRSGADDYMTKPFAIGELAARCEAALRRYYKAPDKGSVVLTGPLAIDLVTRAVTLRGEHVSLTRKEGRLLCLLASHVGLVITHDQLIKSLWDTPSPDNIQYLRTLVRQLRRKLEDDPGQPRLLLSQSGVGYLLAGNAASPRARG